MPYVARERFPIPPTEERAKTPAPRAAELGWVGPFAGEQWAEPQHVIVPTPAPVVAQVAKVMARLDKPISDTERAVDAAVAEYTAVLTAVVDMARETRRQIDLYAAVARCA
jgi:hypothetical protein